MCFFADQKGSGLIPKPDAAQSSTRQGGEDANARLILNIFGILMQKICPSFLPSVLYGGQEPEWQAKGVRGKKKASCLSRAKVCSAG